MAPVGAVLRASRSPAASQSPAASRSPIAGGLLGAGRGLLGRGPVLGRVFEEAAKTAGQHLVHGSVVVVSLDGGHLEAPVVAALRQAVLEHDHRADVVSALDMAHVVALDAQRGLLQPERLLELLEGDRPARQVRRPPQPVPLQLVLGVLAGCGYELAFASSLRDPHRDPAVAQSRQPRLVGGHVLGQLGDEDLPGDADRRLGIVLLEHPSDQLGQRQGLDLLHDEAVAAHHPPAPHVQHLDGGRELVLGEGEGVEVLRCVGDHLLALDGEADRGQPVAKARRPLELELRRRLAHLGLQPVDDRLGVTVEERHQLRHEPAVLLGLDGAHARARAALDVVEQAGPAEQLVAPQLGVRARPDREGTQEQVERLSDRVGVRIGAEIAGVLAPGAPHHRRLRPLVADGDRQIGIALVVDEADVETGPVRLDQVVLEHDGLDVAADDDPLDRGRPLHHLSCARVQVNGVLEIAREPAAQGHRLADVDDPPRRVLELVRARGVGNRCRSFEH